MIKLFVMDVDGTLTDGKIYMSSQGEILKAFNIKDGYGIRHILPDKGIIPVIITGRKSEIVSKRAEELCISEVYQEVSDKKEQLLKICDKYNCNLDSVAYVGDDVNDLPVIELIKGRGITACPSDAVKEVKKTVDFISELKGGDGVVRDFIERIIEREV